MALRERLRKTLYYGQMPSLERPSLAMTGMYVRRLSLVAAVMSFMSSGSVTMETCLQSGCVIIKIMHPELQKKQHLGDGA